MGKCYLYTYLQAREGRYVKKTKKLCVKTISLNVMVELMKNKTKTKTNENQSKSRIKPEGQGKMLKQKTKKQTALRPKRSEK